MNGLWRRAQQVAITFLQPVLVWRGLAGSAQKHRAVIKAADGLIGLAAVEQLTARQERLAAEAKNS